MIGVTQLGEVDSAHDEGWKESRVESYKEGVVSPPRASGVVHTDTYIKDQSTSRNKQAFYHVRIPCIPPNLTDSAILIPHC